MSRKPTRERYVNIDVTEFICATYRLSMREVGAVSLLLMAGTIDWDNDRANARSTKQRVSSWRKMKKDVREAYEAVGARIMVRGRHDGRKWLSPQLRQFVWQRDEGRCAYCGADNGEFHVDHIVPVAKGGSNDPENLTIACAPCNMSKGDRLVSEWRS